MTLKLDWCSLQAALYACERWHYSRVRQSGKTASLGVWEDGEFVGAVMFTMGSGGTAKWGERLQLSKLESAELARVALKRGHKTPVSRVLAIAIKMLRKQSPGLRLLVSYADPNQGHHGGIYQACGWVYVGRSAPSTVYIDGAGRQWHSRSVSASGVNTQFGTLKHVPKTSDCKRVELPGKFKYLLPLDAETRAAVAPLAKPYPEKLAPKGRAGRTFGGGSNPADVAAFQAVEGGSTPTPPLQVCLDEVSR